MLRSSLFTASAFALVASASAQTPQQINAEPVPGAIKNAGIYHVSTGTWTRSGGQVANFGVQEIIYSNTAGSGYFTSAGGAGGFGAGSQNFDEGGLPGPGNGTLTTMSGAALRPEYNVDGFQIGYCDNGLAASGGWELSFYSEYDPCTLAASAPSTTINVTGLPAGGCWIVTLDLSAATGTGQEFCLTADGNFGTWDNDTNDDSFGWSYTYSGTDGSAAAGFLLTGDPKYTDQNWTIGAVPTDASNTYYGQTTSSCAGTGTGYITRDFWWLEDPAGSVTNCYFFGGYINRNGCGGPQGNPYASFWMEMYGESTCGPNTFGTIYCMSNPNSTGVNTGIELIGSPVAADNDVLMRGSNLATNSFGFFITSTTQNPNPFTPPNSQGNVCVTGSIGRFIGAGQIKNSGMTGEITLDTNLGEWTLTAIPTSTINYAAMTGITSNFQLWHRDVGNTSNFSDGISHTWL